MKEMFLQTPVLQANKTLKNNLLREELDLHSLQEQFIVCLFFMEDIGTEENELYVDTSTRGYSACRRKDSAETLL